MKKTHVIKSVVALFILIVAGGSVLGITVDIYRGHTQNGGGMPYSNYVDSFDSPDIMFWTNSNNNWYPFNLDYDFGAEITGTLVVSTSGNYQFDLITDDGSMVYIDQQLFIDKGGSDIKHIHNRLPSLPAFTRCASNSSKIWM